MITPNPTDRAHSISPLDVFAPAPHLAAQGSQPSPVFAAVLNKSSSTTRTAAHRALAHQILPAGPERSREQNSSDPATVPVGKKRLPKADRADRPQRKSEAAQQDEEQAGKHGTSVPASDAPQDSSPSQDESDAPGAQAARDAHAPQSVDSAGAQATGGIADNGQPLAMTAKEPVDVTILPAESTAPQAGDAVEPTNGKLQQATSPDKTVQVQSLSGDDSLQTAEYAAAVHGNGPVSLADSGQNSNTASDAIVGIDGQSAAQDIQPSEPSNNSDEKGQSSSDESGPKQVATDAQASTLPGSDSLTSPDVQNSSIPPPAATTDAPPPAKDAPQPQSGSSQTTAGVQPNPNRLPQHVLARSEKHHGHNPVPVPIDSARFLSRVAKAFTAAQQRDGEVRLRLSPPELGSLRLQVSVQDGVMVARMETETEAAKAQLTNNLPALRERLAEQGIRVERFDIDLMQRPTTGTPDRPSDPEQQPETQPLRSLRTNQSVSDTTSPAASTGNWNGQGRLNVIV
ncbi:MAG: flagellar hook-length control protein FliK [Pirellulaceae bacterium]